jgi:hypothetical protein
VLKRRRTRMLKKANRLNKNNVLKAWSSPGFFYALIRGIFDIQAHTGDEEIVEGHQIVF